MLFFFLFRLDYIISCSFIYVGWWKNRFIYSFVYPGIKYTCATQNKYIVSVWSWILKINIKLWVIDVVSPFDRHVGISASFWFVLFWTFWMRLFFIPLALLGRCQMIQINNKIMHRKMIINNKINSYYYNICHMRYLKIKLWMFRVKISL